MKNLFRYILAALPIVGFSACSSDEDAQTTQQEKATAPLEVELEPMGTRSAFTSMPNVMEFNIYVSDESNGNNNFTVSAVYNYGKTTLGQTVLLDDVARHVYAAYPSCSGSVLYLYTNSSQTDYLYGRAENASGNLATINRSNPKANIRLKHAMALLTFRIKQNADIGNQNNYINSITLGNIATSAYLDLQSEGIYSATSGSYNANVAEYARTDQSITVQVLAVPYYSYTPTLTVYVNGNGNVLTLPNSIEKGKAYTYDVDVYTAGRLAISNVTIEPRTFGGNNYLDGNIDVLPQQ